MSRAVYACQDCQRKYEVMYFFIRPQKAQCPYCGSSRAQEQKDEQKSCRVSRDEKNWRGFT